MSHRPLPEIEALALKEPTPAKSLEVLRGLLAGDTRSGARGLLAKFEKRVLREERELRRLETLWFYEREGRRKGFQRVAGVDEAGRGPLAGPVVAAAVVLPQGFSVKGVDDSKKLTPAKREELFEAITREASFGLGQASAAEIDSLNIYRAARLAMERAVALLDPPPDFLLTDAMPIPSLSAIGQRPLVHGDALSISIAAASILAKVTRDRLMAGLEEKFPGYGFLSHKGYGTEEHLEALERKGPCPEHRTTFAPVAGVLAQKAPGGPFGYWKAKLQGAGTAGELQQWGMQIKRIAAGEMAERDLEALRAVYKDKLRQLG